jgi:opacity protein-like surface antigen
MLLAGLAQAESEYGTGEPTFYLAASGLIATEGSPWDWGDRVRGGANLRMGFRLGAPLAFELQGDYINLKDWREDSRWDMTLNFRVYPTQLELIEDLVMDMVPDTLQPYAVAGVGVMGGSPSDDKYQLSGAFRLGLGLDIYATEQMAVSLGYEWVFGTSYWSDSEAQNLTLGLQYNF